MWMIPLILSEDKHNKQTLFYFKKINNFKQKYRDGKLQQFLCDYGRWYRE